MLTECRDCGSYRVISVEDNEQECLDCGFKQLRPSVWYVNAYRITLGYGGPEEGGWYYSIYEPIASIPVSTQPEEEYHRDRLEQMFPNPDNKSSVAPDAHDIFVCVEEKVAEASPGERPHYE